MAHYTGRVHEYAVLNATHLQLDPVLDYTRAIARVAGPGNTIYRNILKNVNMLCYSPWEKVKGTDIYYGLVDSLPYAEKDINRDVRRLIFQFMKTVTNCGLMDYNLAPPSLYQDELPGELLNTMIFNPAKKDERSEDKMNNVNIEVYASKTLQR